MNALQQSEVLALIRENEIETSLNTLFNESRAEDYIEAINYFVRHNIAHKPKDKQCKDYLFILLPLLQALPRLERCKV